MEGRVPMDSSLLELLNEVTLYDLIIALILIVTLVILVTTQKKKISKVLDKWRKNKNEEEDFTKLVYSLKDDIEKLSNKVQQNQEERDKELLEYREDSNKIHKEMYDIINKHSKDIQSLLQTQNEMKEKEAKTKRAEFKEKIEKLYRECHPSMKCTDMQLEVLRELIEEYEEHGGVNSFVHSTVEPEMVEWEIIKQIKE